MNAHNKSTKMSPASFRKCFPTLAAAIEGEPMTKEDAAIITAAPVLLEVPEPELTALRLRKERGEELWKQISGVRALKREKSEQIASARAEMRCLEKEMENLEEYEEDRISAHLCLDGGPGQGLLPFAATPTPASDDWKEVPTSVLIPNAAITAKLVEAGLDTFGKVEAWRAKVSGPGGEDHRIKGFGAAKMQIVEDAVVQYWIDHPVKKEENSVASTAPVE